MTIPQDKTAALEALDKIKADIDELLEAIPRKAYDDYGSIATAAKEDLETIRTALLNTGWQGMESCPIDTHGKHLIFTDGKKRWFDTVPPTFDKEMRQWIGEETFDMPTHWTDTAPLPPPPSDIDRGEG